MVEMGRALKIAMETGVVRLGLRQTTKALRKKEAKLVILARDFPRQLSLEQNEVRVHFFDGNSIELGAACGKPFAISAVAIIDPGGSDILSI